MEPDRSKNSWFSRSALESMGGPSIHKCFSMRPQLISSPPRMCLACTRFLILTKVVLLGGRTLTIFWGNLFFFYCIAELAIKPCRSSRSKTRGGFEKFHDTCKKETKHDKTNNKTQTKQPKHQHKRNTASVIGW